MKKLLLVALLLLSTLGFTRDKPSFTYCDNNTILFWDNDSNISVNYQIYDIQGKLIKNGFSNMVDLSDVSYGVYVLIFDVNGNETSKIYRGELYKICKK